MNELPKTSQSHGRASVCVVIAEGEEPELLSRCLDSVRAATPDVVTISVPGDTPAVNRAIAQLAPADVVLLSEPCLVSSGWLERLQNAARGDSNTATASALANVGGELALSVDAQADVDPAQLAGELPQRTLKLHPRMSRAVGPCVYVRREALELVGPLDEAIELPWALEVDFAQGCVLSGLAHVAADDLVVTRLTTGQGARPPFEGSDLPPVLVERYPYLDAVPPLAEAATLALALRAARGADQRLWVTLDARALDGAVTGTQVHILELILALAHSGQLRLRLLVREERIDPETLELLRGLPDSEILPAERIDSSTPPSTIFHRPQQTFSPGDVTLALRLGERFVLSQLDLIAYRNPGYFADAGAWGDYRRASRHGLSAADRVVVFSDHTRRELLSDALVEDERIRVVAPGLDHRVAAQPQRPAGLDASEQDASADGFLLCLGTDFRHKNRPFALRMLASLRDHCGWNGRLVLAGTHIPIGSSLDQEQAYLEEHLELRNSVLDLGPVSEQEKTWLIEHAGAVLYPSVYEGFGLVPFESALLGVPCVFAPQASLAEEAPAGTATILPWDPRASAAAAYALLGDPDARARHVGALAAAGRELTWEAAANAMVRIYREAALAAVRDAATLSRDAVQREARLSVEHEIEAAQLVREREHAQRMYDELNAEVGDGLSLIGPHGALPEGVQRALLALTAHPMLSGPVFALVSRLFVASRAFARVLRPGAGRTR